MKSELVLSILLAASAAGGGYWLGQRHASSVSTPSAGQRFANPDAARLANALPPVPVIRATSGTNLVFPAAGRISLAEIDAKILELKQKGPMGFGYGLGGEQDFQKLLLAIEPADIPAVLGFVDQNLSKQVRSGLRYQLLLRWAEADVTAAMAYAYALTDRQEREGAIGVVAGAWAAKDSQAAAAWAKQLPQGQLRDQVFNSIVGAMAAKDPPAQHHQEHASTPWP